MKVVVVFKWSKNPQDARVGADGSVDWRGVKLAASYDDPAAMEVATSIASDGEIIGLTIGDGDIAWAAARGAARTIVVTDAHPEGDSSVLGKVFAAAIQRIDGVDVVLVGDSDWDYGVVASLMGQLGWSTISGVVSGEKEEDYLKVTRKIVGTTQVLKVKGPVVMAVSASRDEKSVPGMKEVLVARKKPVERLSLADLNITHTSTVKFKGTRFPDTPPAKILDGSDPVVACEQLITALQADGVL